MSYFLVGSFGFLLGVKVGWLYTSFIHKKLNKDYNFYRNMNQEYNKESEILTFFLFICLYIWLILVLRNIEFVSTKLDL